MDIHSDANTYDGATSGHAWISIEDTDTGEYHTYGLYPDIHGYAKAKGKNGPESDVRMDWEIKNGNESKYEHTYTLNEQQYYFLNQYISNDAVWDEFLTVLLGQDS